MPRPHGTGGLGRDHRRQRQRDSISTTTGTALSLNNVAGTISLTDCSHNGAGTGIDLVGTHPAITCTAGTIQNTTGTGISINGGTANFSYAGTITNSAGRSLNVQSHTGGTVTLSGLITDSGTGINLTATAARRSTSAAASASAPAPTTPSPPPAGAPCSATQNNTTIVNTIATTTGQALRIQNTTIGGSGLTFRSISSNGGTNNGITLDATGAGLHRHRQRRQLHARHTDVHGGAIQNKNGADGNPAQGMGVYLNSVSGAVSLSSMDIEGRTNYGIRGLDVSGGLTIASTMIGMTTKNGTSARPTQNPRPSPRGRQPPLPNLTGTVAFSNDSSIAGSRGLSHR